jgi:hypothetical protein
MERITVITADVVDSRRHAGLVERLGERLSALSHPAISTGFSVSRGDEVQAMLRGWLSAPEVIRHLRYACRPARLRVGMGIGILPHASLRDDPWLMNGPAFYDARQALDTAKTQKRATVANTGIKGFDAFLNCIWSLVDSVQEGWTGKQWEAVSLYEREGTYARASAVLGISPQNVQKRCKAARWDRVREAERVLAGTEAYLEKYHLLRGETGVFTD